MNTAATSNKLSIAELGDKSGNGRCEPADQAHSSTTTSATARTRRGRQQGRVSSSFGGEREESWWFDGPVPIPRTYCERRECSTDQHARGSSPHEDMVGSGENDRRRETMLGEERRTSKCTTTAGGTTATTISSPRRRWRSTCSFDDDFEW